MLLLERHLQRDYPRFVLASKHHRTWSGEGLSFDRRPWLLPIYMDEHHSLVAKKCSQIGWTEFAIATMFSWAQRGIGGIYVMPSDAMRKTFVSNRIDNSITYSSFYRANTKQERKAADSVVIKTLFNRIWKFAGSNSPKNFYEFPAGGAITDEYDLCDQDNLIFLDDRLRSNESILQYKFGNPTLGDRGITVLYEQSDKRSWQIKCPHCNEEQPLNWFVNVVREVQPLKFELRGLKHDDGLSDIPVVCRKCEGTLDRLSAGRWIAESPGNNVHGYHVNGIFGDCRRSVNDTPVMRAMYREFLVALTDPSRYTRFMNNILGESYAAADAQIVESIIQRCVHEDCTLPASDNGTVAGVDINLGLHTVIRKINGMERYPVWMGQCSDYNDLEAKCRQFGVKAGCIDSGPEIHAPREWIRNHPNWYRVSYNKSETKASADPNRWFTVDDAKGVVSCNRTECCDKLLSMFRTSRLILPKEYLHIDDGEYVRQLKVPTRVKEIRPDKTFRWIWTKGVDHYFHAENYCMIAAELYEASNNLFVVV